MIREIDVNKIKKIVYNGFSQIAFSYPKDIKTKLSNLKDTMKDTEKEIIEILLENEDIAFKKHIPLCQDTGLAIIYLKVGQDVHFINGDLNLAINDGVRDSYKDNYLRNSVVNDPLFDRTNTLDNTPCIIYCDIVEGSSVQVDMTCKGFGSENMSRIKMCKPAEGINGIIDFVIETVKLAGPNACPPMVVGVGIGGDFEKCALMAKQALFRSIDSHNIDSRYAKLEDDLLSKINDLNIGPAGLKGVNTALKVNVEYFPTHIAGLPVACNISCHATRHISEVI